MRHLSIYSYIVCTRNEKYFFIAYIDDERARGNCVCSERANEFQKWTIKFCFRFFLWLYKATNSVQQKSGDRLAANCVVLDLACTVRYVHAQNAIITTNCLCVCAVRRDGEEVNDEAAKFQQ